MKLLLTAFDPFGGQSINPALEAVKQIPDQIHNTTIIKLEVPTVFNKSIYSSSLIIGRSCEQSAEDHPFHSK